MSKVKAEHDSDYDDTPEGAPGTTKRDADSDGSDDEEAPAKKKQKQKQEEKGTESPARAAAAAGPFTGSPPKPTKNAEGEIYFQVRAVYCSKVDAVFLMTGDFVCGFGPGTTFTTRQISQLGQKKRLTVRRYQKNLLFDIREFYTEKGSGEEKPGKKGISLTEDQFKALSGVVAAALEASKSV